MVTGTALVDDGGEFDARGEQIRGEVPPVTVGSDDDNASTGRDAVEVEETLDGAAKENTGQVVVVEERGHFDRSGRENDGFRSGFEKPVASNGGKPVVLVPAEDIGIGVDFDSGRLNLLKQVLP